jgi:hypothetical protein
LNGEFHACNHLSPQGKVCGAMGKRRCEHGSSHN